MDPPSFSTTHKSRFTTVGGTAELVSKALGIIPAGGLLITSSNLQKMTAADYIKQLRKGASSAGRQLQVAHVSGQADDFPWTAGFPEGNYLKYVVSVVQDRQ
jgi:23S rRNA (cytosine1962-C5)-methyltransferase